MHSRKRLWTLEARARKHLKLAPNTILAIMRHGCSILTATISRSFIKAKLIFIVLMLNARSRSQRRALCQRTAMRPLQPADVLHVRDAAVMSLMDACCKRIQSICQDCQSTLAQPLQVVKNGSILLCQTP